MNPAKVVAGLVCTLVLAASAAAETPFKLEVGQSVPDLVLPTLDGAPASLAEFRGQKVILHVFASW